MKFEDIKKLHQKKFREELGYFLSKASISCRSCRRRRCGRAPARERALSDARVSRTGRARLPMHVIKSMHMAQISETRSPQGIVAVVPMLAGTAPRPASAPSICTRSRIPGNLGTILRTLAWFGDFRCLLSPDSVDVHNGKVVRASMGAIFHVPVEIDVPLESLPARFARIACLDLQGQPIASPEFRDFDCYLFGNEARGLPREALAALNAQAVHDRGHGRDRVAECRDDGEHLPVRAAPRA